MGYIQEYIPPIERRFQTQRHGAASRLLHSMRIGFFGTLIITLLEILVFALLNPFSLSGSVVDHARAFLILPIHTPILVLFPIGEFLCISIVLFFVLRPLAIYDYMRLLSREY